MIVRTATVVAAALLAAGCAAKLNRVTVDAGSVTADGRTTPLACPYRLGNITDARPAGDRAGQLGRHILELSDAPALVRTALAGSGFVVDSESTAPQVGLRVLRLYVAQQYEVKIPVAVLEARVNDQPPFLIRTQASTFNWVGSENEAQAAFGNALGQAREQLVARLNAGCNG